MTKRLSLILMLLLISFMSEAKVTSTKDEVNVASVQAGIQNAVEHLFRLMKELIFP